MQYVIGRLPENCPALELKGEFFPENLPLPWSKLNEAKICHYPWGKEYAPECAARVGWNSSGLHVLMYANEPEIRAEIRETGGSAYTDSCLEFFVSADADGACYANCETNPLAVMLLGLGTGRHGRFVHRQLPDGFDPSHSDHRGAWWAISYTIPAGFLKDRLNIALVPGGKLRGNFYKCGDAAQIPHYGMFRSYDLPQPDFHRPELFAEFLLEE